MDSPFVVVAGGTGFIGTSLRERLVSHGYSVKIVTRNPRQFPAAPEGEGEAKVRYIPWDIASLAREMEGAAAVVNLAGESVASGRWTPERKKSILESRLDSTQTLVDALGPARPRPILFLNASAVGYYGSLGDDLVDESSPPGADFLADVCRQWEARALEAETLGVRVVCLRIGIVLGVRSGALARMLPAFRFGLGGPLGSGGQWMSWIHESDLTGLMEHLIRRPPSDRIVNGVAPRPATNLEFSRTLARVLGRPCFFRVPAFMLRLMFGDMSLMLLGGQRVAPKAALAAAYSFRFPELEPALRDLLAK